MKTFSAPRGTETLQTITCPLCGEAAWRPFLHGDGFHFVRCVRCAVVYQNPRPSQADLRRRYSAEYFSYELSNEASFFKLMELSLGDVDFDGLTAGLRPRRFLDIGCATGMLLSAMQAKQWEVQGVDLCRESAEYGTKTRGVPIFAGTIEEAHFGGGSFDAVHFSHLIEHVTDPRGLLTEVRRILKPNGYAVVTTPNVDGFQARLFGSRWRSAIPDHLTLFSPRTLRRLLDETGFGVQKMITWGGLAQGTAPGFIKKPADVLAKKLGCGDVMLFLARARPGAASVL